MGCAGIKASRYAVGKVRISDVTMPNILRLLDEQVQKKQPAYVCVSNVRTTVLSQKDESFCRIQNESLLSVPDGMPLVWFGRLAGLRDVKRIVGAELMTEVLRESVGKGYSHYFLGDTEETLAKMTRMLRDRWPGVVIMGMLSPPFRDMSDAELDEIANEINLLHPSFVWVALGAPKQERFMVRLVHRLDLSILVGVGAAFRALLGEYWRPPRLIQLCGLEGICWKFMKNPWFEAKWYCRHIPWVAWFFLSALYARIRGSHDA